MVYLRHRGSHTGASDAPAAAEDEDRVEHYVARRHRHRYHHRRAQVVKPTKRALSHGHHHHERHGLSPRRPRSTRAPVREEGDAASDPHARVQGTS
jgi:hypothetical protein